MGRVRGWKDVACVGHSSELGPTKVQSRLERGKKW